MIETLKPNQHINISTTGDNPRHFNSLTKVVSGERIFAELCKDADTPADLSPGMKVRITYSDSSANYAFSAEISAVNSGSPVLVTLDKLEDFMRIQRRAFVRIDVKLQVRCGLLDENMVTIETFGATTMDVSGGGIRFGCNVPLNIGQWLEATVYLGESQTVTGTGEVVRVIENSAASNFRFSVGFKFKAIRESDRDKIVRFIFDQQRKLRNKGLL